MSQPNVIIISEKSTQAKAYSEAFQVAKRTAHYIEIKPNSAMVNGAILTWCSGHLLELCEFSEYEGQEHLKTWSLDTLPIQFGKNPKYKLKQRTASHAKATRDIIRKTLLNCQNPICIAAPDCDTEGAAIAKNLIRYCFNSAELQRITIKHLWVNSLDKDVVFNGFHHLLDDKKLNLMAKAATVRSIADFTIGANASRLYSLLIQRVLPQAVDTKKSSYSVGRVQSPTLFLLYNRERVIANFVPTNFYELYADFIVQNGSYKGKTTIKSEHIQDVEQLLASHQLQDGVRVEGVVASLDKQEKKTASPKLHSLTTIQIKANKLWKMSPDQTLKTAQSLYEQHKLISYPRTSCCYIGTAEYAYLLEHVESYKQVLGVSFENAYITPRKRHVDNTKIVEHYGLIPTKIVPTPNQLASLSKEEQAIYFEILRTTLSMFHRDYTYEETVALTTLHNLPFRSVGKVVIDKGFKTLWQKADLEAEVAASSKKKEEETQNLPLLHLNERSIGVPLLHTGTTKAPGPYTLGELLTAMETCGATVDDDEAARILKDIEGIGTVATRASIIETLRDRELMIVEKNIAKTTAKGRILCLALEGTLLSSPTMTAKWETYLQKIEQGLADENKFLDSINQFSAHLKSVALKTFNTTDLPARLLIEAQTVYDQNSYGTCIKCGKGELQDKGNFIGCSGFKDGCTFSIPKTIAKKKLTASQITTLLEKGKTTVVKGFVSKAGKKFEARLVLDNDFKAQFDFTSKPNVSTRKS